MTARHEAGWVPDTTPGGYQGQHRIEEEQFATRGYQLCGNCVDNHFIAYPESPGIDCGIYDCQCWCRA